MIYSVDGDIADLAPKMADAAVLWMRSGFNMRCATWDFRITKEVPQLQLVTDVAESPELVADAGRCRRPWAAPHDSLWRCVPQWGRLRYLYVFANPTDLFGYQDLNEVGNAIRRALDCLNQLKEVRNVAFLHIPYRGERQFPTREQGEASADEMVAAIRHWDQEHQDRFEDLFLVDLRDGFRRLAPSYPPGG